MFVKVIRNDKPSNVEYNSGKDESVFYTDSKSRGDVRIPIRYSEEVTFECEKVHRGKKENTMFLWLLPCRTRIDFPINRHGAIDAIVFCQNNEGKTTDRIT